MQVDTPQLALPDLCWSGKGCTAAKSRRAGSRLQGVFAALCVVAYLPSCASDIAGEAVPSLRPDWR